MADGTGPETFCCCRINLLGADIDPDLYLQIPRQYVVEGQRQDGMEMCG